VPIGDWPSWPYVWLIYQIKLYQQTPSECAQWFVDGQRQGCRKAELGAFVDARSNRQLTLVSPRAARCGSMIGPSGIGVHAILQRNLH
jgi:hypothetical protein